MAALLALGCTAGSDDPVDEPDDDAEDKGTPGGEIAQTDQELTGGSLVARWNFNESTGQTVLGFNSINGFLGSTSSADARDPLRSTLNAPTEDAVLGRSLQFRNSGTNAPPNHDFVTIPAFANGSERSALERSYVSVEAWVRTSSPVSTQAYIVAKGVDVATGDCSAPSYGLYLDAGGHAHYVVTASDGRRRDSGPSATAIPEATPKWHHLVGTYSGTVAKLYVDGVLASTGSTGTLRRISYDPPQSKSDDLYFGAYNGTRGGPSGDSTCKRAFSGRIDNVRLYSGALTAGDVLLRFKGSG